MTSANTHRLDRDQAQLLVVDIQEKLLPHIAGFRSVVDAADRMIRAARAIEIPLTISEQYPQGLGATVASIAEAAGDSICCTKMTFSFCADSACRERIQSVARPQVLLVGIESHVCVLQTALDLLALDMQPFVLADAVGSRRPLDYDVALDGLRAAGVVVTTVESAIFQLVHESGTPLFKSILPLVR